MWRWSAKTMTQIHLISCRRKPWPFLCAQLAGAMQITAETGVPFRGNSRCPSGVQLKHCSPRWAISPQDQARPGPKQEKPWNVQSVDAQHQLSHSTSRGWTVTRPDGVWANWSNSSREGMIMMMMVLHPTASSMLSLENSRARQEPAGWTKRASRRLTGTWKMEAAL